MGKGWSLTRDRLEGLAYPGGDPSCSWAWWLIRRACAEGRGGKVRATSRRGPSGGHGAGGQVMWEVSLGGLLYIGTFISMIYT